MLNNVRFWFAVVVTVLSIAGLVIIISRAIMARCRRRKIKIIVFQGGGIYGEDIIS